MTERVLDNGWVEWTRLNITRNCDTEGILEILLKEGFAVESIRKAMGRNFPASSAQLRGKKNRSLQYSLQPQDKRESVVFMQRQLAALNPRNRVVERRSSLGRAEFLEQYYSANRPVILCDLLDNWGAMTKWTPEYLKSTCGDMKVEIQAKRESNELFEIKYEPHRQEVKFADFVDMVFDRENETNDFYLTARNGFFNRPGANKLLDDISPGFAEYCDTEMPGEWLYLWFGPKGTVTPLHHDEMNIFLAQVTGKKTLKMIPPTELDLLYNNYAVYTRIDAENPDYERFPRFQDATVMDVELNPGEVLFIPAGWWHHVRSHDPSISISFINFLWPNSFEWVHPDEAGDASGIYDGGYGKSFKRVDADEKIDHKALHDVPVEQLKKNFKKVQQVDTHKAQIFVIDDFLTEKECDDLVAVLSDESVFRPSTITNPRANYRTSYSSDLSVDEFEIVKAIDEKIARSIGICLSHSEGLQAQKYEIGQEFKPHTDYFEPNSPEYDEHCIGRGNRTWTVMVYLQDTTRGGATCFTKLGQRFYPKKGKAVAWNNLREDGSPNPDTTHWGMPVEAGQKMIITKWFRELGDGPMFYEQLPKPKKVLSKIENISKGKKASRTTKTAKNGKSRKNGKHD